MLSDHENNTYENFSVLEFIAEMLWVNQVTVFLNWLYLVNEMINEYDFSHAEKNFEYIKGDTKIIGRMCSKISEVLLSASQIAECLHRLYLKNELMN